MAKQQDDKRVMDMVQELRACIKIGLRATIPGRGGVLGVHGSSGQSVGFSADAVEDAVANLHEPIRSRAEMLLGLGPYAGMEAGNRRHHFARTWAKHYTWENVRRTQATNVLREVAAALLASGQATVPYDYEVVEYCVERSFPESVPGERIDINSRLLRALVPSFRVYRQQHVVRSRSGSLPSYRLTSPGHHETKNVRNETVDGASGYRYDFEVSFQPVDKGQRVPVKWTQTTEVSPVDLAKGEIGTLHLTPTVPVHHAKMTVRFDGQVPRRIWRLENALPGDMNLLDPQHNPLPLVDGVVSSTWTSPAIGRTSAIGWQW